MKLRGVCLDDLCKKPLNSSKIVESYLAKSEMLILYEYKKFIFLINQLLNYPKMEEEKQNPDFQKLINHISLLFRKEGINYQQSKYIIEEVRKKNELKQEKKKATLPEIPSKKEIEDLLNIALENNYTHYLAIRLMITTGLRVSELINIKCQDVYLHERKIFIKEGKTGSRYVLFSKDLLSDITAIVQSRTGEQYLILSKWHKKYTRHGISRFIREYINKLGNKKGISPHKLRHFFTTTISGSMTDSEAMLLTGHKNKKTIGIYQHLSVNETLLKKYDLAF